MNFYQTILDFFALVVGTPPSSFTDTTTVEVSKVTTLATSGSGTVSSGCKALFALAVSGTATFDGMPMDAASSDLRFYNLPLLPPGRLRYPSVAYTVAASSQVYIVEIR
jgi:hypothetical protein